MRTGSPVLTAPFAEAAPHDVTRRVLDALLRENVRECVTRGRVQHGADTAVVGALGEHERHATWLVTPHWTNGTLHVPVRPGRFLQDWHARDVPAVWTRATGATILSDVRDLLACFRAGLGAPDAATFAAFDEEVEAALLGHALSEEARHAYFAHAPRPLDWAARMLRADRLGAFADHPAYPTSRAKVGFDEPAWRAYAPEFGASFELRWLAVPRERFVSLGEERPACWPSFRDVGLPASLEATHDLVPVHPFLWNTQLDALLVTANLAGEVVRARRACLRATPTLSVRTVALADSPDWHVKLPLPIRTLGLRNVRFMHPGTLGDGARIGALLARLVEREGLADRVMIADETNGGHAGERFLAFLLRRYPAAAREGTLVPVASLMARTPAGRTVLEELARNAYAGDTHALWREYLDLTLRLHVTLWARYGVTLESNQQNTMLLVQPGRPLRLLLKDNDAPRILSDRLAALDPEARALLNGVDDTRIFAANARQLADLFTTITLHLNVAALIEGRARTEGVDARALYTDVRERIERVLAQGDLDDRDVRACVLNAERLPVKLMLTAGSLLDKRRTGAADVNKHYAYTAPNYLRPEGGTRLAPATPHDPHHA